jgi:hypothetical protein
MDGDPSSLPVAIRLGLMYGRIWTQEYASCVFDVQLSLDGMALDGRRVGISWTCSEENQ